MSARPLTTSVEAHGDTALVVLSGRLDRDGDAAMETAYEAAIAGGARTIHLDFVGVDYINSTGIALIVRLLAEARRDACAVVAAGLSEHYREIFRITRLSDFMTIEDGVVPAMTGGTKERT
ncbi:MAG TPA: STAS domain-containing protein [Candidatus Dormibacteraeota bacterium]|nr:STAS domain-containing protein [Candidatus Dormibacteraeota bacterium]